MKKTALNPQRELPKPTAWLRRLVRHHFMNDTKQELADLIKQVAQEISMERGAVCAVDCLLQWRDGRLDETMTAWRRYMQERRNGEGHTDECRNGAWVPAIPL